MGADVDTVTVEASWVSLVTMAGEVNWTSVGTVVVSEVVV